MGLVLDGDVDDVSERIDPLDACGRVLRRSRSPSGRTVSPGWVESPAATIPMAAPSGRGTRPQGKNVWLVRRVRVVVSRLDDRRSWSASWSTRHRAAHNGGRRGGDPVTGNGSIGGARRRADEPFWLAVGGWRRPRRD